MPQPGRGRIEAALPIGEGADHAGPSADLLHDPLEGIVGPDLDPVAVWEGVVGQRLADAFLDQFGRPGHPLASQLADHRVRLLLGRVPALLGVDGLEHLGHLAHLGRGHVAENIAEEMHHAALPPCIGKVLSDALHQAPAGIRDDRPHTREAPVHQVAQEGRPAGLVLLGPLADAQDLPVALRVHRAGHQQRNVAHLARPGPLHDDPVQVQIVMLALDRPVAPFLDLGVYLLVQVRNRARRHPRAPQCLGDVLHAPNGKTGQIHLDQRLLDRALPTLVALDDRRFERLAP